MTSRQLTGAAQYAEFRKTLPDGATKTNGRVSRPCWFEQHGKCRNGGLNPCECSCKHEHMETQSTKHTKPAAKPAAKAAAKAAAKPAAKAVVELPAN